MKFGDQIEHIVMECWLHSVTAPGACKGVVCLVDEPWLGSSRLWGLRQFDWRRERNYRLHSAYNDQMPTSTNSERPDSLLTDAIPVGPRMGTTPVSLDIGLPSCIDPWHWSNTFCNLSTTANRSSETSLHAPTLLLNGILN